MVKNGKSQTFQKTLDKYPQMWYNKYSKGEIQMKEIKTIEKLKEMPKNDGCEKPKTIGDLKEMLGEYW